MYLRVLLVTAIVLKLAGYAEADYYPGLVVLTDDYKKLPISVVITENDTLAKGEILRAVKLRLMANNITPLDWKPGFPEYLYVEILAMKKGSPFRIDIYLKKKSDLYAKDSYFIGSVVTPQQGMYGSIATGSKSYALECLNECLDAFLIDYLETNMRFQKNLEAYKNNPEYEQELKEFAEGLKKEKKAEAPKSIKPPTVNKDVKSILGYDEEKRIYRFPED